MPFGVLPAPEEFQRRIDIALEGLQGQKASRRHSGLWSGRQIKKHLMIMTAILGKCSAAVDRRASS